VILLFLVFISVPCIHIPFNHKPHSRLTQTFLPFQPGQKNTPNHPKGLKQTANN